MEDELTGRIRGNPRTPMACKQRCNILWGSKVKKGKQLGNGRIKSVVHFREKNGKQM